MNIIKEQSYWRFYLFLKNVQIKLANNEKEFYNLRTISDNSDKHILTPLDIVLNLEKCAYSDDINLPAMIVIGELPLINLTLTDKKLIHILRILKNLDQNVNIEVEEERHFYLNLNSNESSFSSLNSEYDLELSIKNISKLDETPSLKLPATNNVPLQNINIELRFEIKDIVLSMSEESTNKIYFDKILFRLSSIGALVQIKSYDIVGNIYLSYIALEYEFNDSKENKLYLISSLSDENEVQNLEKHIKNEKNRLIDIHLTQTDETSPTLSSIHKNSLCDILIEFRNLNFLIDEYAISNVLRFINELNKSLNKHAKIENKSLETVVNKTSQANETRHQETDFVKYNENQIDSLLNNQKYKDVDGSLVKEIVQYTIRAKIDSIKMRLSNLTQKYFQVLIQNFETNLKKTKSLTELDVILTRISFQDIREDSLFKEIIKLKDGNHLIEFNLKFFEKHYLNKKTYLKSYLNENDFDLIINGKLSKLQCVFLYQHLSIILVN